MINKIEEQDETKEPTKNQIEWGINVERIK